MMSGYIVRRGKEYLARKSCKSTYADDCGWCWSEELQAARIYKEQRSAEMAARRVGGTVRMIKEGRGLHSGQENEKEYREWKEKEKSR